MEIMGMEEERAPDVEELPLFRNGTEIKEAVSRFKNSNKDWTVHATYSQDKPDVYPSVAFVDANKEKRTLSLHFIPLCSIIPFAPEMKQ